MDPNMGLESHFGTPVRGPGLQTRLPPSMKQKRKESAWRAKNQSESIWVHLLGLTFLCKSRITCVCV